MNENGDAFKYYHTVYDTWLNSIFDYYEPTFKLLVDFVDRYQRSAIWRVVGKGCEAQL